MTKKTPRTALNRLFLSLLIVTLCGCGGPTPPPPAQDIPAKHAVIDDAAEPLPNAPEKDDDASADATPASPLGAAVKASVDEIMLKLKRTLYTNSGYAEDPDCLLALDCSAYVKLVLMALPPEYYEVLPKSSKNGKTALAEDYYEYFRRAPADPADAELWMQVKHIKDVRPGDIIAYKYTDSGKHSTTGHVMVAYSRPAQSRCDDADQYWVYVSDSANSGHRDDTRNGKGPFAPSFHYVAYNGSHGEPSGVGIGKLWFNTGSSPYYRWNSCSGNKHSDIQIAIGRPIRLKAE